MSLSGILGLVVIAGIAGGAYYYRDGIKDAFGSVGRSDEEKALDLEIKKDELERKKKNDDAYDNLTKGVTDLLTGNSKDSTKQVKKTQVTDDNISAELRAKTDYDLVNGKIVLSESGEIVQTSGLLQSLSADQVNLKGRRFH